jgi:RNA polymerase sigma-70 factor (ECF subfamily)
MNATLQSTTATYSTRLHRFLRGKLRNPADVDDLTKEVYRRLLATPDDAQIDNPLGYLYGTAHHALAEHYEQQRHHEHVVMDSDAAEAATEATIVPDDMAERLNLQQQIDRALAQLTPRQQKVLIMHKRDGLSYDEIAVLLNISWETVSRHIVDAKARLRTARWER